MRKTLALVLCLLMAFSVVACTAQPADDEVQNSPAVTDGTAPEGADENQEEVIPEGGTLVVAVSAESDSMLVTQVRSTVINMWPIFEGLFKFDSTGAAVPFLVESYEEDLENLTYTLHMHEGYSVP